MGGRRAATDFKRERSCVAASRPPLGVRLSLSLVAKSLADSRSGVPVLVPVRASPVPSVVRESFVGNFLVIGVQRERFLETNKKSRRLSQ